MKYKLQRIVLKLWQQKNGINKDKSGEEGRKSLPEFSLESGNTSIRKKASFKSVWGKMDIWKEIIIGLS